MNPENGIVSWGPKWVGGDADMEGWRWATNNGNQSQLREEDM